MIDQSFALSRSKSDNQITKTLVWSPTPIRGQKVDFLDKLNTWQDSEAMNLDSPPTSLSIRKYQSLGALETQKRR